MRWLKNILCIIVALMMSCGSLVAQSSKQTYKETFLKSINTCNLSMIAGGIKDNNYKYNFALGASISAYGVYFAFAYSSPAYNSSTSVGTWSDSMSYAMHGGFQIPILEYLKVAPVFGVACYSEGTTDGYHYSVSSSGINNVYIADTVYKGFDYGLNIQYSFTKSSNFKIDVTFTRLTFFVGAGFILRLNNEYN